MKTKKKPLDPRKPNSIVSQLESEKLHRAALNATIGTGIADPINSIVRVELGLDYIFTFGKHKGEQLEDVIEDYPHYIEWMLREDVRQFDEEVLELLESKGISA